MNKFVVCSRRHGGNGRIVTVTISLIGKLMIAKHGKEPEYYRTTIPFPGVCYCQNVFMPLAGHPHSDDVICLVDKHLVLMVDTAPGIEGIGQYWMPCQPGTT